MPIIKAAVKHLRQSHKRHQVNRLQKNKVKDEIKALKRLARDGKKEEVLQNLPKVYKLIDKAAKKNLLHKNNAARKKSALAHLLASK